MDSRFQFLPSRSFRSPIRVRQFSLDAHGRFEYPDVPNAISMNPGAPLSGSIMQCFLGSFNGTHSEAVDGATWITDFGKDSYAGQFFYGLCDIEEQVFIAWPSNWQCSEMVPTGPFECQRSSMSLPRQICLANVTRIGYDLILTPYNLSSNGMISKT